MKTAAHNLRGNVRVFAVAKKQPGSAKALLVALIAGAFLFSLFAFILPGIAVWQQEQQQKQREKALVDQTRKMLRETPSSLEMGRQMMQTEIPMPKFVPMLKTDVAAPQKTRPVATNSNKLN